jgi:hypothetical protein
MPDFCPYCHQPLPPHLAGRPRKIVDLGRAKVLLDQGLSLHAAADLLHVSYGTFRTVIRAAGYDHRRSPVMALRSALGRERKSGKALVALPVLGQSEPDRPPDST